MASKRFVCEASDINSGTAKGFCIEEEPFFIVNNDGRFFAYRNRCPHLKIPLEWQENSFICQDTELLRCATHGALFLPDSGLCVSGPCSGQSLQAVRIELCADGIYWCADEPK